MTTANMGESPLPQSQYKLGKNVEQPQNPDDTTLDRIPLPDLSLRQACVRFSCPEFTSLCPVTGQPDFARIYIDFVPNKWLVESKSLKLFLGSFRNVGSFHEACTIKIANRLVACLEPTWLRVTGLWYPRGGIPIDIFYQTGLQPQGIYVPQLKLYPYEGR